MRISTINAIFQPLQQNIKSFLNVLENKVALVALAIIAVLGAVAFFVFRHQFGAKKQERKENLLVDKKDSDLKKENIQSKNELFPKTELLEKVNTEMSNSLKESNNIHGYQKLIKKINKEILVKFRDFLGKEKKISILDWKNKFQETLYLLTRIPDIDFQSFEDKIEQSNKNCEALKKRIDQEIEFLKVSNETEKDNKINELNGFKKNLTDFNKTLSISFQDLKYINSIVNEKKELSELIEYIENPNHSEKIIANEDEIKTKMNQWISVFDKYDKVTNG